MGSRVNAALNQFNNGLVSPELEARTELQVAAYSCRQLENASVEVSGGVHRRGGSVYVDAQTKSILISFIVNRNISYLIALGGTKFRFYRNHAVVQNNNTALTLNSPYAEADLFDDNGMSRISCVQSADVLYLFHEDYPTYKITRTGATAFSISKVTFVKGPWEDEDASGITMTVSDPTVMSGTVTVHASAAFFTEDMVGRYIRIYYEGTILYWSNGDNLSNRNEHKSDGKFYKPESTGEMGNVKPTHTTGLGSDGKINWRYMHAGYGTGKITAVTDGQNASVEVVEKFPENTQYATKKWKISSIGADGVYPIWGCFFKERLCLGVNTAKGPTVFFSQTGDYENFDDVEFGEIKANCGMKLPILGDISSIEWLSALDSLYVGTSGGITEIKPQTSSQAFGPENITYGIVTNIGSNRLKPVLFGGSELYCGGEGKTIYDLLYVNEQQSYEPDEVSLLAPTWLKKGIKCWALQYHPYRIVWCVMRDGTLVGLTYNKAQQVRAFHKHITDGKFVSVAVIPSPDGQTDELWAVVERTINNTTVYYIEYFRDGLPLDIPAEYDEEQQQAFRLQYAYYVDCGAQYTFETPQTTITGLAWLNGKTVDVLADGVVIKNKTISNGTLTLDTAASVVTVGLPYTTTFEPLPVYVEGANGTGNARAQRINKVVVRLLSSGGFWYGEKDGLMDYASLRKASERGNATSLKSGDLMLNWNGTESHNDILGREIPNATGARMIFMQKDPLPMRILAVYPQLEITND